MVNLNLNENTAEGYLTLLKERGENGLYKYAIAAGIKRSVKVENPENEILDLSDSFFILFRRTGEEKYFFIGKILRRAAHVIYRQLLKINDKKSYNARLLQMVK